MKLTNALGIKFLIIQGTMAKIATADLASAVSNTGGIADGRGIADVDGYIENGSVMKGQISGLINKITSVEEAIESMISEVEEVFGVLGKIRFR